MLRAKSGRWQVTFLLRIILSGALLLPRLLYFMTLILLDRTPGINRLPPASATCSDENTARRVLVEMVVWCVVSGGWLYATDCH